MVRDRQQRKKQLRCKIEVESGNAPDLRIFPIHFLQSSSVKFMWKTPFKGVRCMCPRLKPLFQFHSIGNPSSTMPKLWQRNNKITKKVLPSWHLTKRASSACSFEREVKYQKPRCYQYAITLCNIKIMKTLNCLL